MHAVDTFQSLSDYEQWAEQLNAGSFLNAFFREWREWYFPESFPPTEIYPDAEAVIAIPLKGMTETILVSVKHWSACGRHQFFYPFHLNNPLNETINPIRFIELVTLLTESNSLWNTSERTRKIFLNRVTKSIANTAETLKAREKDLQGIYKNPVDFQTSEQSLIAGHSVHPTPKSRDPFSTEDARKFIPEFGNSFQLNWVSIETDLLEANSVHAKSFRELTRLLAEEDKQLPDWLHHQLPENHTLLPVHPWQFQQWLNNPWLSKLHKGKRMINHGQLGLPWRATSSVRSIHAPHASFMLKYSLSVKLTNSLRHLLPKEVIRGKEIHQVKYKTDVGQLFRQQFPYFDILTEPAHAGIKGPDGKILPETMIVFRENPFQSADQCRNTELLATLTQDNPAGESRIVNLIHQLAEREQRPVNEITEKWFQCYLNTVVKPLIIAQSDYGILFGAHQQNLLLTLSDGYPEQSYFRDCQGTGYSHLARALLDIPNDKDQQSPEHHVEANLGNHLFTYYLMINSTFGVISALGADPNIAEQALIKQLKQVLNQLRQGERGDSSCLDYLLESPELWSKGNFYCAYSNLNENTLNNPLAIYHAMKNPLVTLS